MKQTVSTVAYFHGAFWISPYRWNDPIYALKNGKRDGWTWIGAPGWFYNKVNQAIYEALAQQMDMSNWHDGEAEEIDITLDIQEAA